MAMETRLLVYRLGILLDQLTYAKDHRTRTPITDSDTDLIREAITQLNIAYGVSDIDHSDWPVLTDIKE